MSFRLFIYYCALCGGCAAYLGWVLGRFALVNASVLQAGFKGMFLGMALALCLALIDALWNMSPGQVVGVALRVLTAQFVGGVGGFVGGMVGQVLYGWLLARAGEKLSVFHLLAWVFLVFGWVVTGLLIGASVSVFDVTARVLRDEAVGGARRKLLNGILGGSVGGLLGGVFFLLLQGALGLVFSALKAKGEETTLDKFWSPGAFGFVILGMCIGLLIGLAQVILKEAWIKVEAGFRPGRELILSKEETSIGRAEGCDVGLFGDPAVEKLHARILRQNGRYVLVDEGSADGTGVTDEPVRGQVPLHSGDVIRLGKCVLRFGERQKRAEPA